MAHPASRLYRPIVGLALGCLSFLLLAVPSYAQQLEAFIETTGPDKYPVEAFKKGVQLALEKHADSGLTVQFLDVTKGSGPVSGPLAFYWNVDDVTPVAPKLVESEVIGLVSWDVTKKVAVLGRTIFGFGFSTEGSFKELAKFAGNKLKSYRIGLISTSEPRFETRSKAFSEQWRSLGNTVVFDEKVNPANADFGALVARAQKETCDTIVVALPATAVISFIKAARQASFKGKLLVGDTLFAPDLAALGKDADGVYMIHPWTDDEAFGSLYTSKHPGAVDKVTLGAAALGYDAINCIVGTGQPISSETISYSFASTPCEGLTGRTGFDGERIAKRKKRVVVVKGGEFTLAE